MKKIFLLMSVISMMNVSVHSQSIYNYKGSGALNALTSWTLNPGGTNPPDFTSNNQIFVLTNVSSANLSAAGWTVSGTGSEIQIGDGISSTNLTVASNATLMVSGGAKLRVKDKGTITLYQASMAKLPLPSDVIVESGSTVNWNQSSNVTIWALNYYNLGINVTTKSTRASSVTTVSNIITTNSYLNIVNSSTLTLSGDVSGGTFRTIWGLGSSNSVFNITGSSTNSISIILPTNDQQIGGINLSRPARVKINKPSGYVFIGNAGSAITSGTLDLSNTVKIYMGGSLNFGGGYITGSTNLYLEMRNAGAVTGSILFEQASSNTKALKELVFNKSGQTLTLGNALDVYSNVNVVAGTLASGGNLTLKSSGTSKARINTLSGLADITGNVNAEVFAASGTTGWTNLAVAGISGQTMASGWGDDFPMTCPSGCPNGSTAGGNPFTSVTTYNETSNTYPGISSGSDPITPGVGYWVYLGNGQSTTTDILIDLTGSIVKKGAGSWSFTKTSGQGEGWNLVGNPYPSPISFAKTFGSSYGSGKMLNELRVWNPDLNSGNGDYALYKVGVGSTPAVGSGGINDNIPMGQAFYILANQAFSLSWSETFKTTNPSNNPLLKTMNNQELLSTTPQQNRLFYLNLTGSGADSYAGIHFNANATMNYHPDYDAEQRDPYPGAPQVFAVVNNQELKVKGLPYPNGNISLDMKVRSGTSGNYQLALQGVENIPYGACITLFDKFTNTTHNLLAGPYSFSFSDTTTVARFVLNISMNSLSGLTTNIISTPSCHNDNTGIIEANMGSGNYTFVWKDINNQVLKTVNNVSKDSLKNIGEGYYFLEVTDGACSNVTQTVQLVANTSVPVIDFTTNADTLQVNTPFVFSNNSQNLTNFEWYFGDETTANTLNATHSYSVAGNYLVFLQGTNSCGDTLTTFKEVIVTTPTGLNPQGVPTSPGINVSRDKNGYYLTANYTTDTKVNVLVTDILGRTLIKKTMILGNNKKVYLHNLPPQQIVVIRTEDGYNLMSKKIYIEE